jgi:hypothetical protein
MPVEVTKDPAFIRVTISGVFADADLRAIADALAVLESDRSSTPPRLTDMRAVTELQIGYAGVSTLAELRRRTTFDNAFKSAIVVATPAQRGMARMFQTLNDHPKISIEIFDDEASAVAWLKP